MAQQSTMMARMKKWMGMGGGAKKDEETATDEHQMKEGSAPPSQVNRPLQNENKAQLKQLASEQSELIGELTDKLTETEIKLQGCCLQSKHLAAQNIVKTYMASGGAMAFLPIPVFDFASLAGTQLGLVRRLAKHYEVDFDETKAKTLLVSLLGGVIPLMTVVGLSSFAKIIPGIGSVGGGISMSVLSGGLVFAVGQVFIQHFEEGGTLNDFDSKQWISTFKQSVEKHKALKQFNKQ